VLENRANLDTVQNLQVTFLITTEKDFIKKTNFFAECDACVLMKDLGNNPTTDFCYLKVLKCRDKFQKNHIYFSDV